MFGDEAKKKENHIFSVFFLHTESFFLRKENVAETKVSTSLQNKECLLLKTNQRNDGEQNKT